LEIINKEITYKNGTIITITSGNEMSDNIAVVKRSGQSDIVYMGILYIWDIINIGYLIIIWC